MDIFGQVGAPRWNDPDEDRLRYRQLGHQSGQLFAQGFMSAYDQARDEKVREQEIQKIKAEVAPVVEGLKGVGSYEQMMDRIIEHPEWMLNPRTSPIVGQMTKNWEAAEAIRVRAENSQQNKAMTSYMLEYDSARGALPRELDAQIDALPDKGYTVDVYGRPKPSSAGLYIVNRARAEKGLPPVGAAKGDVSIITTGMKAAATSADRIAALDAAMERTRYAQEQANLRTDKTIAGQAERQQAGIEARSDLEQSRQAFREHLSELSFEHKQELSRQMHEQMTALQRERLDAAKQGKMPSGLDAQTKVAVTAYQDALKKLNEYPKSEDHKKRVFEAELQMLYFLRLQEKQRAGTKAAQPPGASPQSARRRRYNPETGNFEEIE